MFRHRERFMRILVIVMAVALIVSLTLPLILAGR
jgi:hypothetical protein